ncbi:MAG: alpha/beta fold hydrolase [Acidimicrobiia bacterium]
MLFLDPASSLEWSDLDSESVGFHSDGLLPPIVLIRTWSDELKSHVALAQCLGESQPLYSIGVSMTEDDFPRSVLGWADRCTDVVGDQARADHAIVGGFSFGGVVALEVADRLQKRGISIAQVLLLDSSVPRPKERQSNGAFHLALRRIVRSLDEHGELRERFADLATAVANAPGFFGRRAHRRVRKHLSSNGASAAEAKDEMPLRQKAIWVSYLRYQPVPLDLPGAVLTTDESRSRADNDFSLGWSRILGGPLQIHRIAGQHFSMFDPNNIRSVTHAVRRVLPPSGHRDASTVSGGIQDPEHR